MKSELSEGRLTVLLSSDVNETSWECNLWLGLAWEEQKENRAGWPGFFCVEWMRLHRARRDWR